MAIPAGTKFGPYEILGLIGAGGMGEVHRARDTRLGREVAIKTLPPGLAGDAERLRRFEIEAKAASLLSHPNIVSIYDIGTSDGQPYIVSELLEGETLRERLGRGPLLPRKAVEMASTIAQALAATHARGIVHRDLKPENLFITRDGATKILDFGIAKLTLPDPAAPGATPTVTRITESGVAIGTLGYMAPEQLRGEAVDHRSDIFALGAILHEAMAGAPAFHRESRVATMNAVLESDPPELPEVVAPAVRRIVRRCLEKHPDDRFQSARDLAFALTALSDTAGIQVTAAPQTRNRWRFAGPVAAVAAVLMAAIAGALIWSQRAAPLESPAVKRFSFQPTPAFGGGLALSPDGSRLVYRAGGALQMRSFDELEARPLAGTEGATSPFFSPDGQWVAFTADSKLKKVPVGGGAAITLGDVSVMMQGSWALDGTLIIAQRERGLMTVPAEGGVLQPFTTPDAAAGEIDHHAPEALPGGGVIFTSHRGPELFRIVARTPSGDQRTLIDDAFFARYLPPGYLVYGRADGLFAAPFNLDRLELAGQSVPMIEDVSRATTDGFIQFAVAADGTLAYGPAVRLEGRSLFWIDRAGRPETIPAPPRAYHSPTLSPDGTRIAVEISDGPRSSIWVYELQSGSLTRVSSGDADSRPLWSPDGQRLSYAARRKEERHIVRQPIDASAPPESLLVSRNTIWPAAWTADERQLIYVEDPPTSIAQINLLRVDDKAAPEPLIPGNDSERQPSLSPDGQWLAYVISAAGRQAQVFVRPFRGGTPRQITSEGGREPRWTRSGREIFLRRPGSIDRIAIQTSPQLVVGKTEKWFDDDFPGEVWSPPDYDVSADGQRFLMLKAADTERVSPPIQLVLNWVEELKRRVPTRR